MHLCQLILGHPLGSERGRRWEQQPAYLQDFLETLHLQEFDGEHHARQQLAGSEAGHIGAVASPNVEHVDLGERAHRFAQRPA
jgi:hypothetical protein